MNFAMKTHFKDWYVRINNHSARLKVNAPDSSFNESGIYNIGLAFIDNNLTNCYGGPFSIFEETEETEAKTLAPSPETPPVEEQPATPEAGGKEEEAPKKEEGKKRPSRFKSFLRKTKEVLESIVSEPAEDLEEKKDKD